MTGKGRIEGEMGMYSEQNALTITSSGER